MEEAGALWESVAQHHAFIYGNKRAAFAATYTILSINGTALTADPEEAFLFISGLYERREFRFEKLVPWLRSHVKQNP